MCIFFCLIWLVKFTNFSKLSNHISRHIWKPVLEKKVWAEIISLTSFVATECVSGCESRLNWFLVWKSTWVRPCFVNPSGSTGLNMRRQKHIIKDFSPELSADHMAQRKRWLKYISPYVNLDFNSSSYMYTRNQQDGEIEFSRSDAFLACQTPRVWTLSQL